MRRIYYYFNMFDAVIYGLVGYHLWVLFVQKGPMIARDSQIGSFWYQNWELKSWLMISFFMIIFVAAKRLYAEINELGVTERMPLYSNSISWDCVESVEKQENAFGVLVLLHRNDSSKPWKVDCKRDASIYPAIRAMHNSHKS